MAIGARLRFEVFKCDGFVCRYCGARPNVDGLHVDHITPRSKGGTNDMGNLVTACRACNLGKAAIALDDKAELDHDQRRVTRAIGRAMQQAESARLTIEYGDDGLCDESAWLEHDFPLGLPEGFT